MALSRRLYTGEKMRLCTSPERMMHVVVFAISFVMFVLVAFYTPLLKKLKTHHRRAKNWFSVRSGRSARDITGAADGPVPRGGTEMALEAAESGEKAAALAVAKKARDLRASSRRANEEMEQEADDSHSDSSDGSGDDVDEGKAPAVRTKKGQGRAAIMSIISAMFGLLFWLALVTVARCHDKNVSMSWTLWLGAGIVGFLGMCSTCCGIQIILMDRTEKRKKLIPPAVCLVLVVLALLGTAIAFASNNGFFEFECLPGFYSATAVYSGWNGCDRCPAGSFCPGKQEPSVKCAPGHFCNDGAVKPSKCPAGKFFDKSGAALSVCCSAFTHDLCELNEGMCKWGRDPKNSSENACLWSKTPAPGSLLTHESSGGACCQDCPAGKYALEGSSNCTLCPSSGKEAVGTYVTTDADVVCSGLSRLELKQFTCDPQDYSKGLAGGFEDSAARVERCDKETVSGYCDPTVSVTGSACVCVFRGEKTTEFSGPACEHTATLAEFGCRGIDGTECDPRSDGTAFNIAWYNYKLTVANSEPNLVLIPRLRANQNIRYHHVATGHAGPRALDSIVSQGLTLFAIKQQRPDDWANCSAAPPLLQNTGQLTQNAEEPQAGGLFQQTFDLRLRCDEPRLRGLCSCAGSSMVVMEINNTLSVPGQDPSFKVNKNIYVKTERTKAVDTRLSQLFKPQQNDIERSLVARNLAGVEYKTNSYSSTRDFGTDGQSGGFTYNLEWREFHRTETKALQLTPISQTGQPLSVTVTLNRTLSKVDDTFFAHNTTTVGIDSEVQADPTNPITVLLFPDESGAESGKTYQVGGTNFALFDIHVQAEDSKFKRWYRLNVTAM